MNNSQQQQRRTGRNNGDFKQYLVFEKKFGYLHDFREIPNSSPKVYTAKISVPQGQGDRIKYVNFELYVKSAEALSLFLDSREHIDDENTKVTVRFSCSYVQPKAYIAQSGQRAGDIIPYFSGNLSYLFSMKVNGEQVYGFRPMGEAANDSQHNASQQDAVNVDPATGEVLPIASNDEPPQRENVPVDAYEDDIAMEGSTKDDAPVMDDGKGTDSPDNDLSEGRSQGKKSPALTKARGARQAPAKGKAKSSQSAAAN